VPGGVRPKRARAAFREDRSRTAPGNQAAEQKQCRRVSSHRRASLRARARARARAASATRQRRHPAPLCARQRWPFAQDGAKTEHCSRGTNPPIWTVFTLQLLAAVLGAASTAIAQQTGITLYARLPAELKSCVAAQSLHASYVQALAGYGIYRTGESNLVVVVSSCSRRRLILPARPCPARSSRSALAPV
jgi:hypothetical protein